MFTTVGKLTKNEGALQLNLCFWRVVSGLFPFALSPVTSPKWSLDSNVRLPPVWRGIQRVRSIALLSPKTNHPCFWFTFQGWCQPFSMCGRERPAEAAFLPVSPLGVRDNDPCHLQSIALPWVLVKLKASKFRVLRS